MQGTALQFRCSYGSKPQGSRHAAVVARAVAGGRGLAGRRVGASARPATQRLSFESQNTFTSSEVSIQYRWPIANAGQALDKKARGYAAESVAVDFL